MYVCISMPHRSSPLCGLRDPCLILFSNFRLTPTFYPSLFIVITLRLPNVSLFHLYILFSRASLTRSLYIVNVINNNYRYAFSRDNASKECMCIFFVSPSFVLASFIIFINKPSAAAFLNLQNASPRFMRNLPLYYFFYVFQYYSIFFSSEINLLYSQNLFLSLLRRSLSHTRRMSRVCKYAGVHNTI